MGWKQLSLRGLSGIPGLFHSLSQIQMQVLEDGQREIYAEHGYGSTGVKDMGVGGWVVACRGPNENSGVTLVGLGIKKLNIKSPSAFSNIALKRP